jgi:hypothetical protein
METKRKVNTDSDLDFTGQMLNKNLRDLAEILSSTGESVEVIKKVHRQVQAVVKHRLIQLLKKAHIQIPKQQQRVDLIYIPRGPDKDFCRQLAIDPIGNIALIRHEAVVARGTVAGFRKMIPLIRRELGHVR